MARVTGWRMETSATLRKPSLELIPEGEPHFTHKPDGTLDIHCDAIREMNVLIATPCYGGMCTSAYALALHDLTHTLRSLGASYSVTHMCNESLITRARNGQLMKFISSPLKFTHFLCIDGDIKFIAQDAIRLLAYNLSVVGATYPKKGINWDKVEEAVQHGNVTGLKDFGQDYAFNWKVNMKPGDVLETVKKNGCTSVEEVPTGFFCVQRWVVEKMMDSYPDRKYLVSSGEVDGEEYAFDLFAAGVVDDRGMKRYLSEDYYFCRLWRNLGGQCWLDSTANLSHYGTYEFKGDVHSYFEQLAALNGAVKI